MFQKESCTAWKFVLVAFTFFIIKIVRGDFCIAILHISIVRVFRSVYFKIRLIRSLLIHSTPARSSFRLLAETFYSYFKDRLAKAQIEIISKAR